MKLIGYKISGQDVHELMRILGEMKEKTFLRLKARYKQLLVKEVEAIFDEVSLNMIPRPKEESIFEAAIKLLEQKIIGSSKTGTMTPYNFTNAVHVFYFEGDTYIKVQSGCWTFGPAFSRIRGLQEFHVKTDVELELEQGQIWQQIMAYSEDCPPLGMTLFDLFRIPEFHVRIKDLKFHSVKERAAIRARHDVSNRLLGEISGGNIPNYKLMPYLDDVLELLGKEEAQEEMREKEKKLRAILRTIDEKSMSITPETLKEEGEPANEEK